MSFDYNVSQVTRGATALVDPGYFEIGADYLSVRDRGEGRGAVGVKMIDPGGNISQGDLIGVGRGAG